MIFINKKFVKKKKKFLLEERGKQRVIVVVEAAITQDVKTIFSWYVVMNETTCQIPSWETETDVQEATDNLIKIICHFLKETENTGAVKCKQHPPLRHPWNLKETIYHFFFLSFKSLEGINGPVTRIPTFTLPFHNHQSISNEFLLQRWSLLLIIFKEYH